MIKNPYLNALAAVVYIAIIVSVMHFLQGADVPDDKFIAPITFLSMLVLSVSVMGYIFFYQPARLYLDGAKEEAVALFTKTVGTFAVITVILITVLFLINRV